MHELPRSWRDSDRFVPRAFVQPVLRFMQIEAAAGVVMLVAALVAVVWANSPWWGGYERLASVTAGTLGLILLRTAPAAKRAPEPVPPRAPAARHPATAPL